MTPRPSENAARYAIDGIAPARVIRPTSVGNLRETLTALSSEGSKAIVWGGGTRMALGNPPAAYDVALDLAGLDRVVAHNPGDLTITVEAGITIAALQAVLAQHGQFLAIDPPLPERATVGGTLAVGTSGPLKWQYGNPRDLVIGMSIAQPDGTLTKSGGQVVKNVSGYDMARLHIGGMGTLGVIAQASFKLAPLPVREATLLARYENASQALDAALDIFRGHVIPSALAVFDPASAKRLALPNASWHIAARLGGRALSLERQVKECNAACKAHTPSSVEALDDAAAKSLWRKLADFGWDDATRPVASARVSLLPGKVKEFVAALGDPDCGTVSHPAHGTILLNWYAESAGLADSLTGARALAQRLGGIAVFEQCPPSLKKTLDVWGGVGETLAIMRRMKEQYDPSGTLNPGRFAGGI
ncbi:MAG: FAD-binding oxidoreductase [SAR202 cluster bacterium]|nr:FAD-binding oxidoreductase [SAR202 cluster bacterium]